MNEIEAICERLKAQDNRLTTHPMFCVQILRRDVGYHWAYSDKHCWQSTENKTTVYDDDKNFTPELRAKLGNDNEWDLFGYVDRWETVMVCFTEGGCNEYLELNGHNDRSRAHNGQVRIYVESFNHCPEMIKIRDAILRGEYH